MRKIQSAIYECEFCFSVQSESYATIAEHEKICEMRKHDNK